MGYQAAACPLPVTRRKARVGSYSGERTPQNNLYRFGGEGAAGLGPNISQQGH